MVRPVRGVNAWHSISRGATRRPGLLGHLSGHCGESSPRRDGDRTFLGVDGVDDLVDLASAPSRDHGVEGWALRRQVQVDAVPVALIARRARLSVRFS